MNTNESIEKRIIEIVSDELTVPQLDRVMGHFDRHDEILRDATPYHDLETGELKIIGVPSQGVSDHVAKESLARAIHAARYLHPSDNLDMSA